ncbi:MAG: gliding motility-associated C-terminal domain-containing protein [Saprospiraceae bacterium]|nr:gliding motility-associated C-terminal domain-containing protein [Saprospiraceae bacterium]
MLNVFARNLDQNDTLTWLWQADPMITGPLNVPNPTVVNLTGERWLYVTATNQFGCSATDSVYVAVVDTANVLDFDYVVSCNGSNVQFVNTSTNAFNFAWNFGDPTSAADTSHLDNPIYNYPGPGTYTVQLTMDFALACVDTLEKEVEIVSTQFIPDFTYEYLFCETDSVEVLFHDATIINQAGITADSFLWVTSNGDTSTLANPIFTIYEGESFIVTMTVYTSNGCNGVKTEELKLEFIKEYLDSVIVLCPGDSVAINPEGPTQYQYNWTPNEYISDPTAANPTVWPPHTMTYTVEITDFSPDTCSITREVVVFVPDKIGVAAQPDTISCGGPMQLCASADLQNISFQWAILPDGFVGNGSCLTVFPSGDTEYEVTGIDQFGCTDKDTVFIADESVKLNWQNLGAECPSVEVPITVNNLVASHDLTYAWSVQGSGQVLPPATGPSVTVVTPSAGLAANYTVTATNQFGCTGSLTQSISGYAFVPTVVDSLGVCPNVSEPINPGADATLMYTWSPATGLDCTNCPNPSVTVSQSTNYTVIVSGNFGSDICKDTIGVEVFAAPIINITETADTLTCGEPVQISAQVDVPYQSIVWTTSSGEIVGNNVTSLTVEPADEETYIILVTDAYQCTEQDTVLVANHELDLEQTGGGVIDTCPMPSYNICIINLDPNDLLEYHWTASNGGTILSGDMSACPVVTSQQGVTSVFIAETSNQWGCTSVDTFDITTYTFDPIIRQTVDICPEMPTPLNPAATNSTLDYYWSPSTGLSCTNCPNPIVTLDNDQFYQVQILGYNGLDTCSFVQTVQVRVMPKINLTTLPTDTLLCDTTDLTLTANYSSNFVTNIAWSESLNFANPFATTASTTVSPNGTVTYYVQLTDTLGCKDTAQISVLAYPVDIQIGATTNFCFEPGSLVIPVFNNHPDQTLTFTWTPEQFIETQNPDGSILVSGLTDDQLFIVDAENQYGCHDVDSTMVIFYDINATLADSITSSMDTILYGSEEFSQLDIDFWPGYTYAWTPSIGLSDPNIHNPQAKPDETTTYVLTITDEGGCEATRTVTIYVWNPDCDEPNLFLPNAFTPNGDGENDELWLRSNIVVEMELAIYNRWGQRVFYTDEQPIKWNGAMNNEGEILPPDAYGFYLKAKCYNGQEYFKKGNITLLR